MIDAATRIRLLHDMLLVRIVEEVIAEEYPKKPQEMRCPTHLCIGQEATPVGVCAHLGRDDLAMSGHRSHGHYLAKGGDLDAMVAELYGRATGCSRGRGGSMHLIDLAAGFLGATPIVASTIPISVGAAFGSRMRGNGQTDGVVVSFFGDAAVEEGTFHEAMSFAAMERLPVVFVCENNQFSTFTRLGERQPDRLIMHVADAHKVPAVQGDGNDVEEVWHIAGEAVRRARAGRGPTFLEFLTYRMFEHCGPFDDSHLGYRPEGEREAWAARCPVERQEKRLRDEGLLDEEAVAAMRADCNRRARGAIDRARTAPFPDPRELLDHVHSPIREDGAP